jgi:hypothetical protein
MISPAPLRNCANKWSANNERQEGYDTGGEVVIAVLISLPAQICVASVFVGAAVWLTLWTFNDHNK